jgi:nucleoside-diphosphate-sugar epimerase
MRLSGVKPEIRVADQLIRPSDEKIIFGDTSKIQKDTGWKPRKSLEQTLARMIAYWEAAL